MKLLINSTHHYVMCHHVLKDLFLRRPKWLVEQLYGRKGGLVLWRIWETVRDLCDDDNAPSFSISDVEREPLSIAACNAVLLNMPEPTDMTEAFFVLMVAPPAGGCGGGRFLTLEKGSCLTPESPAALCEWSAEGTHRLIEFIDVREQASFLSAAEKYLLRTA